MRKKMTAIFTVIVIIISSFTNIYASVIDENEDVSADSSDFQEFKDDVEFLTRVMGFVKDKYLYEISYDDILDGMYKGVFNDLLDKYSVYYTPDEYESFSIDSSGEYSGIGIRVSEENENITVISPLKDTPAYKAGIKPRDIIAEVDGKDVTGMNLDTVVHLIRGPSGTSVSLKILRQGKELYFTVKREQITLSSVETEIIKKDEIDIGYIKILQFNQNTMEILLEHMEDFDKNGITDIIVDLRNNPGGLLQEVINILNLFVPKGPLAYVTDKDGDTREYKSILLDDLKYNLCVLVNEGSASASEIFAGAVKDRKAGIIIGTQTYGKGIVQSVFDLKNDISIKLTTAEYLTAGKNKVHEIGITPDIIVENVSLYEKLDLEEIPQLKKDRKPDLGTVGLDVLAAEKMLSVMEYFQGETDGVYDINLKNSVSIFQQDNNLYPYGILDYSTQEALSSAFRSYIENPVEDLQLKKAVDYLIEQNVQ